MSLELFQQDNAADRDFAAHTSAPDLPATFGDTFSQALSESYFFGQSVSRENTRRSEIGGYADEIHKRLGTPDSMLTASAITGDLDAVRKRAGELSAEHPDLQLPELTDDELERRMLAKSRDVRASSAAMSGREKTAGGVVGGFLGGVAGGGSDPVNVITFPLAAPAGLGILKTGLAWAGIAGGTQAAIEQIAAPWHDAVEPGYNASAEPAANILGSAATGGVIGGGIKGIAEAWKRVKYGKQAAPAAPRAGGASEPARSEPPFTGYLSPEDVAALDRGIPVETVRPLGDVPEFPGSASDYEIPSAWPRTIRDAGNAVESEANIAETNPFGSSIEAETAHRDAVSKAVDDLVDGKPVEVEDIVGSLRFKDPRIEALDTELNGLLSKIKLAEQQGDEATIASLKAQGDELINKLEAEASKGQTQTEMPLQRPVSNSERAAQGELASNLTRKAVNDARADPLTDDAVTVDLDRLRAEKDVQVPVGETIGPDGKPTVLMRSIDSVIEEIDQRLKAANEIKGCAGPQSEAAE